MTLAALIQKGGLSKVASANLANSANEGGTEGETLARLATLALAQPRKAANDTADPLPDPSTEARRQRVLAMLAERPDVRYAVITDTEADPEAVLLTLAIRGQATAEFRIPAEKYDSFLLLDLIDRHGGTVH